MISTNPDIAKAQEQRMRDTLRLAQTKLNNTEESLHRLNIQLDSLRKHHMLGSELEEHMRRLFLLNKELATMSEEIHDMERYETFESIMTPFLRMTILEHAAGENRRLGQETEQQLSNVSTLHSEQVKSHAQCTAESEQALTHIQEQAPVIATYCRHHGQQTAYQDSSQLIIAHEEIITQNLAAHRQELHDIETHIQDISSDIENLKSEFVHLNSQQQMLMRSEAIVLQLQQLAELSQQLIHTTQTRDENVRKQNAQNQMLEHTWHEYQETEQKICTLQDELNVHRTNTQGQDSYTLQHNAMALKSRHQMLLTAANLWKSISSGYRIIEEKTQRINELRLFIENGTKNISELAQKVGQMQRLAQEKEYTYSMSKSQNVIRLRADLKEGVACSVCGATNHPYHSESMLDQSKLISEFRNDSEQLSAELTGMMRQLDELKASVQQAKGEKTAEQNNLETIRLRQISDTHEWRFFTHLDYTFTDCDASTNLDARTAMIRQLIENADKDAQAAQSTLDEYNYHQQQIDSISQQIAALETERENINLRMSELNTACQVLASLMDQADAQQNSLRKTIQNLYESLCQQITIPEWFQRWKDNHESTIHQIQQMAARWTELKEQLDLREKELSIHMASKDIMLSLIAQETSTCEHLHNLVTYTADRISDLESQQKQLLHGDTPEDTFERDMHSYRQTKAREQQAHEDATQLHLQKHRLEGILESLRSEGKKLDDKVITQRQHVDTWMHAYNANHPPVQYAELKEVLTSSTDWNQKRSHIRATQMQHALEQARVDTLNSEIIALESETGSISDKQIPDMQVSITTQIEEQEARRRDIILEIARLQIELEQRT